MHMETSAVYSSCSVASDLLYDAGVMKTLELSSRDKIACDFCCDIADSNATDAAVAQIEQRWPLRGIIHTTGLAYAPDTNEAIWRSKVHRIWSLILALF